MTDPAILSAELGDRAEPLVTIVTAVLNNVREVEATIESVLAQTYEAIEYIIIDGGSRDGTLEVVKRYRDRLRWISERDAGIYDAFNKGTRLASGKYLGFLNAGDRFSSTQHLEMAIKILEESPSVAFVYGDVIFCAGDKPLFVRKGSSNYDRTFRHGMGALNHPSMLARRHLFEIIGPFEVSYRISGDFNWLQRLHRAGYRGLYADSICVKMSAGGVSDRQSLLGLKENRISSIAVGMNPIICWLAYGSFVARYHVRKWLERFLPPSWITALRRLITNTHSPLTGQIS